MASSELKCVAIIEKDTNHDVLWTWSFPAVDPSLQLLISKKCCIKSGENDNETIVPFMYGQHNRLWYYLLTTSVKDTPSLPKVTHFAVVLVTKDFNPERYEELSELFRRSYMDTGSPTVLLQQYLAVMTKGSCETAGEEIFDISNFAPRKAFLSASIKDVINIFGVETILIYTAVLLKKKIVFYSPRIETLLNITRAIPQLVWHRQNWNILHPLIDSNDETDIQNLTSTRYYIAGFTDASVENRNELYDIFANISDGEVSIAPHAKDTFQMGKVHKDMAMFMVNNAKEEEKSDEQLVTELSDKTQSLINNLKGLAVANEDNTRHVIKLEKLRERKLTSAMENFLYNLAAAEGMV
ncbi:Hypothetical predicted protein [Paramuricea clavata]|uniref:Uncharacterized protein n=1 Tax=Paramuricea clavata TaxID=317549 RepID=A0A6S7G3D8_PARCT|nr:Hypothetical predicted protein [Paramuricea clavata]